MNQAIAPSRGTRIPSSGRKLERLLRDFSQERPQRQIGGLPSQSQALSRKLPSFLEEIIRHCTSPLLLGHTNPARGGREADKSRGLRFCKGSGGQSPRHRAASTGLSVGCWEKVQKKAETRA